MKKLFLFASLVCLIGINKTKAQSLEDKIGQMLMVAITNNNDAKDTLIVDLSERNLGGVLTFAYNIENPTQIRALTDELKSYSNSELLISVDQEGGIVARLDEQNGYKRTFTAEQLGEVFNREDSTRAQAQLMVHWLKNAGLNFNLAPVVDVNVYRDSPAIGRLDRSFSSDENLVFDHASWFIDEFNKFDIQTAVKHFPGHGSAINDSHFGFTDITSTWQKRELEPFKKLVEAGYSGAIMTGHLFKRDWDEEYPTSISHYAITTILRDSLGFDGVVISDELFMRALSDNYGLEETVVQAINAGTDILLFNMNIYNELSLVRQVIEMVVRNVENGIISVSTIDAAYQRIQQMKQTVVSISDEKNGFADLPQDIQISNYPNPFNPSTNINISLMEAQEIQMSVINSIGQEVYSVGSQRLPAGVHTFRFDASRLASGIYFVRVMTNSKVKTHPMLFVK